MSEINPPVRKPADAPRMNRDASPSGGDDVASEDTTRRRRLLLALLGVTVVAESVAYGVYYLTVARYHESTDDAYVSGNLVQLTPQVAGTVVAVNADDTQIVKAGDPVVTLDAADAKVALGNAEAALGQTVRQVSSLYVTDDLYAANVALKQSDLVRARHRGEMQQRRRRDVCHERDAGADRDQGRYGWQRQAERRPVLMAVQNRA